MCGAEALLSAGSYRRSGPCFVRKTGAQSERCETLAKDELQQRPAALRRLLLRPRLRACPRQRRRPPYTMLQRRPRGRQANPLLRPARVFVPNPSGDPESAEGRTLAFERSLSPLPAVSATGSTSATLDFGPPGPFGGPNPPESPRRLHRSAGPEARTAGARARRHVALVCPVGPSSGSSPSTGCDWRRRRLSP